jgi:hypothetical protein
LLKVDVDKEKHTDKEDELIHSLGSLLVFFSVRTNDNEEEDHG